MRYEDVDEHSDQEYYLVDISAREIEVVKVYAKHPHTPHGLVDICFRDGSVGIAYAAELCPIDQADFFDGRVEYA